jgi:prepilin-type N-terminal cleavage/methylation domain-containing protein
MFLFKKIKDEEKIESREPKIKSQDKNGSGLSTCCAYRQAGRFRLSSSGFTLVELTVVIAIFVFMTALVVANYGSFNDGTLLTSMSYDVALALRDAQSYGLNVEGTTVGSAQNFNYPFGMDFNINNLGGNPSQMILFADSNPSNGNNSFGDGIYTSSSDSLITTYTLARGGLIKCLYVENSAPPTTGNPCPTTGNSITSVDITFKRPNPNAIIVAQGSSLCPTNAPPCAYAVIQVEDASKTSTRSIVVNETGEIAVQNQ